MSGQTNSDELCEVCGLHGKAYDCERASELAQARVRPSVGMWSHARNKWYAVDMHGNVELFETAGQADSRALTNFYDYAEYLEEQIRSNRKAHRPCDIKPKPQWTT